MYREDPVSRRQAAWFASLAMENIANDERKYVKKRVGEFNRTFANEIGDEIKAAFGKKGCNLLNNGYNDFIKTIRNIYNDINDRIDHIETGNHALANYSEWLAYSYNYFEYKDYIEIPGQYEEDIEPYIENHIKIAGFKKKITTLSSLRKPKKLTINGSNEKQYDLLVKGGEDLRLDQRVQQVFKIMNKCFEDDPSCHNRQLKLSTFQVVPITNRAGVIEWIHASLKTMPMKLIIEDNLPEEMDISNSRATMTIRKFLHSLNKNISIQEQHLVALNCTREQITDVYTKAVSKFPKYILRNGFMNMCNTPEQFLNRRANFIKSYSTLCIAGYILGIGDRHLENALISCTTGNIYGIDFGIAFDSGLHLGIPELIPFRLTPQIQQLIEPYSLKGHMKHALYALRKNKNLILDTCAIFVKEPLLEWIKEANTQKYEENNLLESACTKDSVEWYPRKKIQRMKEKLEGVDSAKIMVKELSDSVHAQKDYFNQLKYTIVGSKNSLRYKILKEKKPCLEVEEQIDFLIDHATDPNILGRTWIGWSAFV